MNGITASVGLGGRNTQTDVTIVQDLLNQFIAKKRVEPPLRKDGKMGAHTLHAITDFQAQVLKMHQPDGRIDPEGRTWKKLLEFLGLKDDALRALPAGGDGYYCYSATDRQYGTSETLASIQKLARNVRLILHREIAVGDISFSDGRTMPPHGSHRAGLDVDIRPLRTDKKRLPVQITDKEYDHEFTKKVVEIARRDPNLKQILFNDTKILGVIKWNGHHNHLHVRYHQ